MDYRKVNQVTKFDAYPMLRVEEVFKGMVTALVMSALRPSQGVLANPSDSCVMGEDSFYNPLWFI